MLRRGVQIACLLRRVACLFNTLYFVGIRYSVERSYFRDRDTLHLLMRNLKFYEIAPSELPRKNSEGTDFRATKLSRVTRVTPEISRSRERPVRTADNDWKQRQRTAHAASLIVTVADCFMTVLLFRRTYEGTRDRPAGRTLTRFSNNQRRSCIFCT